MKNTDQRPLFSEYAPYETFWEGFVDYRHGLYRNPYDTVSTQGVESQAWDRAMSLMAILKSVVVFPDPLLPTM